MPRDFIFVSCDIIAHSAESNLIRQRDNVAAINSIVGQTLQASPEGEVLWASGGDGGHVAFPIESHLLSALELTLDLRKWSIQASVSLRITINHGPVEAIPGADGRAQLVGHGINLAGRLLPFGSQSRILAAEDFVKAISPQLPDGVYFHDSRSIQPANFPNLDVYLLSVSGLFESTWTPTAVSSDRRHLLLAVDNDQPLEVIYRAKRLLQANSEDSDARNALRLLAIKRMRPQREFGKKHSSFYDLLLDEQFGLELVEASNLVERLTGETICEFEDAGTTMFLILKGKIGVFFPKSVSPCHASHPPDDTMSPGELAGELAFALRRPRTATLRAQEDTALLAFNYTDLIRSVSEEQARVQIENTLRKMMLSRTIENVWNTSDLFFHENEASALAALTAPWLTLLLFSEFTTIRWNDRLTSLYVKDSSFEGISILVSGKIQVKDTDSILEGKDYPLIYANLPDELVYQVDDCRLLDEVRLLHISKEGLARLGVRAYHEIIQRVSQEISPLPHEKPKKSRGQKKHVFLSYCRENKQVVAKLRDELIAAGEVVWWDENLLGGQYWKQISRKAMKESYAVVFCLSQELISRDQSGVYLEMLDAITLYRQQPPGSIFLLPVRLSDCPIPDIEIDDSRSLDSLHTIDLFPTAKWSEGIIQLLAALKATLNHP